MLKLNGNTERENTEKNTRELGGVREETRVNWRELTSERTVKKTEETSEFFENQGIRKPKISLDSVRWLTSEEAAQYLRVSISSLKTMIYRGQVRAYKLGNRNRFLREELERLITLPVYK